MHLRLTVFSVETSFPILRSLFRSGGRPSVFAHLGLLISVSLTFWNILIRTPWEHTINLIPFWWVILSLLVTYHQCLVFFNLVVLLNVHSDLDYLPSMFIKIVTAFLEHINPVFMQIVLMRLMYSLLFDMVQFVSVDHCYCVCSSLNLCGMCLRILLGNFICGGFIILHTFSCYKNQ